MAAHRVVILGGGFGGLYAARALRKAPVDVVLLDRRNFHLFQPLLYQVATGSLSPGEICAPLRSVLARQKNTRVLLGEAIDIDPRRRTIQLLDGASFEYDSLIVSTGSETNYFGHDTWHQWAPSLKGLEEATAIRHKILYAFEAAEREEDEARRRAWLTFVIVGGGATGVELGGALGEIAGHTLKNEFRSINPREAQILLLDGNPRLLTTYPEDLSRRAEESLLKLSVRVITGVIVTSVDSDGISYGPPGGTVNRLPTKTVLWAGGVHVGGFGRILAKRTSAETDRMGRLKVQPDLTLPGYPEICVIGDLAQVDGPDGKPLPGVAQVAMQGGGYAAKAIVARLQGQRDVKPFHYFDKGDIAVIGRAAAVARIFGFHLHGLIAWLVWLFVHLMYLVQFQSRVLVFVQWGFQYLTFSRGARLITGEAVTGSLNRDTVMKNRAER
ncbi:MAG TPA: NAD(P)/FAD-dependent oxidoreductase [Bryobacteraceae bacterium]|nr:NAD(P)/FAD-dependent oxidoreductase [Bryobacteraceae bacterium]